MLDEWEPWVGMAAAAWSLVAGVAVKAGRLRSLAAMSLNYDNPLWWRNLPFSLLPFGASMVLGLAAVAMSSVRVQTALILTAFVLLIIGLVFLAHPPQFLKPDWLVEEERRRRVG